MAMVKMGGRAVDVGAATADFGRSTALPRPFYLDPAIYELERSKVFASSWVPIARVDQLGGPGAYLAVEFGDEPLVITRDATGTIRVLSNVCRHRGMTLVEGCGTDKVLRCPYHLWTYHLDGTLGGAPLMQDVEGFDRAQVRLPEFAHEIWQGWIFINLDGLAEPLAGQVAGLSAEIADWRFADLTTVATASYDAEWNWKISFENFAEYYHHLGLHRDSLEPLLPARTGTCLDNKGEPWNSSWIECTPDYLLLQGEPMPHLPQRHANGMQVFCLFPLLCAGGQPASAFWLQILPRTVDRHRLVWHIMLPAERAAASDVSAFVDSSLQAIDQIQQEDAAACLGVQRGLAGTAAAPGRLAPLELPLWQMQRWLISRLADGDDTST